MRIGIIHATLNAVAPISEAIKIKEPGVEICNFVNEELLAHANKYGGVDSWGIRNFFRLAMMAAEAELDGIMIACTLYSPYATQLSQYADVPVVAVDRPMIVKAVEEGKKIGVLATTEASGPSAVQKINQEANHHGINVETEIGTVKEAMVALKSGDERKHNQLLREKALEMKKNGCETILLSQITMACAAKEMDDLNCVILTSPDTGAEELLKQIRR